MMEVWHPCGGGLTPLRWRFDTLMMEVWHPYDGGLTHLRWRFDTLMMGIWHPYDGCLTPLWWRFYTLMMGVWHPYDGCLTPLWWRFDTLVMPRDRAWTVSWGTSLKFLAGLAWKEAGLPVFCSVTNVMASSSSRLPRSGELRTQKLKSRLVRTQNLNVLPLKPGLGQYVAIHATLTARDFFLAYFYPSGPFTSIFLPVLALANTGPCVGPQNKIGQPARCRFPLSARGI